MNMMQYSKLNEAGEQIISIRYGGFTGEATNEKYNTYKNILLSYPDIESVTLANHLPRLDYFGGIGFQFQFPEVSEENYDFNQLNGDFDFPSTFDMEIIAGRTFDNENVSDSSAVLLNEAALKSLGITADEAVDLAIKTPVFNPDSGRLDYEQAIQGHVIGVVKDFPYKSMYNEIEPLIISPRPADIDRIIHVKVSARNMGRSLALLEAKWKEVYPDFGFDNWFVNDEFARMYENEKQIASLTEKFSILAILITCVGLYGMASFMATQKTKEIGIRKALGATVSQITGLLLGIFIKLLAIASVVGIPVAFLISQEWLSTFVYQTPLSIWVFAVAMLMITAVTILTVSFETIKAARTNPVTAIRHDN
jgi:putative ABC transport system permease protein